MDRRAFLAASAVAATATASAFPARLKLGLAAYSLRKYLDLKNPTKTLEEFVDLCAEWGVDGAELTEYYFPKPVTPEYVRRLKRRALKAGMDIVGTPIGNTFTHPAGEAREREVAKMKAWIEVSADLGSPAIRTFAGNTPKGVEDAQARKWVVECLQECLPLAEKRGVVMALENHGGVVAEPAGLLEIVNAVKSDWVGINLDTGNFHTADPYADLELCAPLAATCQVKVEMRAKGGKAEPADFPRLVAMLRKTGYRGCVTLEYEAAEEPMTAIPRHLEALRKLLV
jgi:sugar phosphate isomerase/epimerase